jgi:hypothetical protein
MIKHIFKNEKLVFNGLVKTINTSIDLTEIKNISSEKIIKNYIFTSTKKILK